MKCVWLLALVACRVAVAVASITGNCDRDLSAYGTSTRFSRGNCQASLQRADVEVQLQGLVAKISANLTYKNEKTAIDSPVLVLPLPGDAVLQGYEVQDLKGVIGRGDPGAAGQPCPHDMLSFYEMSGGDRGKQRVQLKHLAPEEEVWLRLEYLLLLQAKQKAEGKHVLDLPISFPALKRKPSPSDAVVLKIFGLAGIEGGIQTSAPGAVLQPSALETQRLMTHVLLRSTLQDLPLEVTVAAVADPSSVFHLDLQRDPQTRRLAAALWMPPSIRSIAHGGMMDLVVLLDSSATMHGARLRRAKQGLQALLRSVPSQVRFNLAGFGVAQGALLWSKSRALEQQTFEELDQHLKKEAESAGDPLLGIEPVLSAVFARLADAQELRIMVLTDRYPPDQRAAIDLIEDQCDANRCRLFVIGLGWGASPLFVESAAEAGHGGFAYVAERDLTFGLEKNLISHMMDACVPSIHDVHVQWKAFGDGNLSTTEPLEVQIDQETRGHRGRMVAMALLGEVTGTITSTLHVDAVVGGVAGRFQVPIQALSEGTALHAMALYHMIQDEEKGVTEALAVAHHLPLGASQWLSASTSKSTPLRCAQGAESGVTAKLTEAAQLSTREKIVQTKKDPDRPLSSPMKLQQISGKLSTLSFTTLGRSVSLAHADRAARRPREPREPRELRSWERGEEISRPRSPSSEPTLPLRGGLAGDLFRPSEDSARDARPARLGFLDDLFGRWESGPSRSGLSGRSFGDPSPPSISALSTRQRPGGADAEAYHVGKAPFVPPRLALLETAKLGQRLSLGGKAERQGDGLRSPFSRLPSLSIYDSMLGSSMKSRKMPTTPSPKSTREKISTATSPHRWLGQLSVKGVESLTSRLSLRPNAFPKQLEKLPDPRPGTASAATAAPSAPLAESEAEAEWLGIEVAGDIVAAVVKVKYHQEKCISLLETIQLRWANYSTASVATLTTLTGQVLGVVSARRMQRMHVQVSASCDVTLRDESQELLLTASIPRASHCVAALESGATAPFSAMQLRRLRRQQAGRPMLASNEKRLELDRHVVVAAQTFRGFFMFDEKSAKEAKLSWENLELLSRWCGSKEVAHTCAALAALDKDSTWWPLTRRAEERWRSDARSTCGTLAECMELGTLLVLQSWAPIPPTLALAQREVQGLDRCWDGWLAPWGLDLPWPPFLPLPLLWRLWRLPCLRAPDQQARQGVEDGVGQAPAPLPCFAPHRVSEAEHAQRDVWSCGRRKRLANSYARI
ncbi:unnamed protein product [Cladocopium goreaui]|uniref:VWFA domain-containing protein n=1 Tax=Cladocopium goreaui TaxID=2562237 RepID=A0A9P1DHN5_9DINO|nr:unnamed protein product [Cladocopium goreaui]